MQQTHLLVVDLETVSEETILAKINKVKL